LRVGLGVGVGVGLGVGVPCVISLESLPHLTQFLVVRYQIPPYFPPYFPP